MLNQDWLFARDFKFDKLKKAVEEEERAKQKKMD